MDRLDRMMKLMDQAKKAADQFGRVHVLRTPRGGGAADYHALEILVDYGLMDWTGATDKRGEPTVARLTAKGYEFRGSVKDLSTPENSANAPKLAQLRDLVENVRPYAELAAVLAG